ncbi:MAG: hypothetical protein U0183_22900 [Polyangiaceae bacterium]
MISLDRAALAFVAVGFAALSGCGDSTDDVAPSVSPEGGATRPLAGVALLEGLSQGTLDATTSLGAVRWIDTNVTLEGEPDVRPKLEVFRALAKGKAVEKHHEVARLLLDEGAFLYAGPSVAGEGLDLVYFGVGDGVREAPGIEATYAKAWNGPDRLIRDERLAESFEAAGTYVDPRIVARDRAALSEAITSFRKAPGLPDLTLTGPTRGTRSGYITFSWVIGTSPGVDIAHVGPGGKLDRVVGFY